ncbi:MAG: archaeal proteasome endopeptidase complex subunit alpha [Candidatus Aenigmarchaeota archaeon]|nr:archaeal proteasome endopeptidase complex subunit alpha [Candidatus Aenigmarchaeota archaeon]
MELTPEYMGYDRTIVVFSPDGRLFQVEYAREAIKRGATVVGVKTKDSIVFAAYKVSSELSVPESLEKIYLIDDHLAAAASGLLADARVLVGMARNRAQVNKVTYEEPIEVPTIVRFIADRIHVSTLYAGLRPYGIGLLIGGSDSSGPKLFEVDPSGTTIEWKAHVIGRGAPAAEKTLNHKYDEKMKTEDAIKLAIEAIQKGEKDVTPQSLEIGIMEGVGDKVKFRRLPVNEIKKYM